MCYNFCLAVQHLEYLALILKIYKLRKYPPMRTEQLSNAVVTISPMKDISHFYETMHVLIAL